MQYNDFTGQRNPLSHLGWEDIFAGAFYGEGRTQLGLLQQN